MKTLKLLLIIALSLVFVNPVNAITVYGEFQNHLDNININDNEEVYFDYSLFSMNPPISYSIKMYDSNTNLIKIFSEGNSNENLISNRKYIRKIDYINHGTYNIVIQGNDLLNSQSKTLTLKVNQIQPINHAPILNSIGDKQVNEGDLLQFTINAFDEDNNRIFLSAENLPNNAHFTDNNDGTGTFSWNTNFNDQGDYNVKFIASDNNLQDFEIIKITVIDIPQNNIPTLNIISPSENEVISGIYKVKWFATDNDQDDNNLDVKIEYAYNGYNFIILEDLENNNDGIFNWDTRSLTDANDYKLKITVKDDQNNIAIKEVNFAIDNLFSPNINIISPRENEVISGKYDIKWIATDIDDNNLDVKIEYRLVPPNGLFNFITNLFNSWITLEDLKDNNDGIFTLDTRSLRNREYQLRIIVKDNDENTATGFVNYFNIYNIIVIQNNDPIITSNPVLSGKVDRLYTYDVDAFDIDNDKLTYLLKISPKGMSINKDNGLISWVPNKEGNYNVVVRVFDSKNGFAQQSFTINVKKETIEEEISNHEYKIDNVILKKNKNDLNVFVNINNKGNNKEKIKLVVTDIITGKSVAEYIKLDVNEGTWKIITLNNINKGRHVIKVEAISKAFKDTKYGYIY